MISNHKKMRLEILEDRNLLTFIDLNALALANLGKSFGSGNGEAHSISLEESLGIGDSVDTFAFHAKAGDVINFGGYYKTGAGNHRPDQVKLINAQNEVLMMTESFSLPAIQPFLEPGDGAVGGILHLITETGNYQIELETGITPQNSDFVYDAKFNILRSGFEYSSSGTKQVIFLDFDGTSLNPHETFPLSSSVDFEVNTEPFSTYLPDWNLPASSLDSVINKIIDVVDEKLNYVTSQAGRGDFTILNSRDHADPWGDDNVSRVIIGASGATTGIGARGIAQTFDVGNLVAEETAIVHGNFFAPTINSIQTNTSKEDLVGTVFGSLAVHEIGHYVGTFHTDPDNAAVDIMDDGAVGIPKTIGVGDDEIFGTNDDDEVNFGDDNQLLFEQD